MTNVDTKLTKDLKDNVPNLIDLMNNQNLNEYIKRVVSYSFDANKYFNDSEPWKEKKANPGRMEAIIFTICEQIKNVSILLSPIIPNAADKVLNSMNVKKEERLITHIKDFSEFDHNKELGPLEILFKKIEDDN